MFKKRVKLIPICAFLAIFFLSISPVAGQDIPPANFSQVSLLIVDETKTFENSLKLEILARNIRKIGFFDLSVQIVDVQSSFEIPLNPNADDKRYSIILLFPRGLDDGSVQQVWILSPAINQKMSPSVKKGIKTLSVMVERIFQVNALDVSEDIIPAFLAAVLSKKGWLQI